MPDEVEQIYKLVNLANDNTNEDEANAAARKACLLLRGRKFEFTDNKFEVNKWCMRHHTYKSVCKCA